MYMADREGEHVGLDEGDQQLEHGHEDGEGEREHVDAAEAGAGAGLAEYEDQVEEAERDDVARRDVGEQSDHQYEGLQEHAHGLPQASRGQCIPSPVRLA